MKLTGIGISCLCVGLGWGAAGADVTDTGGLPGPVAELLEAAPLPRLVSDPGGRYALLVHERELLPLHRLAEPAISLAGQAIDPRTHGPHAPLDYYGLTLIDLATGADSPILLPRGTTIGFPAWAPDGSRFAFTLTTDAGMELWIGEPTEQRARRLTGPLNGVSGPPCSWMPDSRHVLCRAIAGARPPGAARSTGALPEPSRGAVLTTLAAAHLLEAQLELIDAVSGQRRAIGGPAAFRSVDPAPSGAFLLVSRTGEPYVSANGVDPAEVLVEIWDKTGRIVRTLPNDRRAVQWHASMPATLVWVERTTGFDRVMVQPPPFVAPPLEIYETPQQFAGLAWLQGLDAALISEFDPGRRVTRVWRVDAGGAETPVLVGSRNVDAALPELGFAVEKVNRWGKAVAVVRENAIYVAGEEALPDGPRPYLDRVRLDAAATTRIWDQGGAGYTSFVDVVTPDAGVLVTSHESAEEPPNYFLVSTRLGAREQLTDYTHPAPALRSARRVPLIYRRGDGRPLSSLLYIPPRLDRGGLLPLVVWAYPRHVGTDYQAGALRANDRFIDFERAFKLFFLLRGYAVLDDVAMPVVGDSGDANDTFIEQIVANAEAAIDAAAATGVVDASRVGVVGHSYGAFMAANLLAHSRLFKAGIALSGAYNRTLTPFGFQSERRTLWQAPETYLAMSPFLYSDRIEAPILLVHGALDANAGTPVTQAIQFYEAIRGTGGVANLLLLPWEGHQYRARESVLETAAAMLQWFDRYLKDSSAEVLRSQAAFPDAASETP